MSKIWLPEGLPQWGVDLQNLEDSIAAGQPAQELPGYVSEGATCYVYRLDESTVGKLPLAWRRNNRYGERSEESVSQQVTSSLTALQLARQAGVANVEQLTEWSLGQPRAWCTEYAGESSKKWQPDTFSPADFSRLLNTVEQLADLDIGVDCSADNIMYRPEQGFVVIDYHMAAHYELEVLQTGRQKYMQRQAKELAEPDGIFYQQRHQFVAGNIPPSAVAFRDICAERYGAHLADEINLIWEAPAEY